MQLIKLSEEDLNKTCSQILLQKAESYVGNFFDCNLTDETLVGKIRGNHGEYSVELTVGEGGNIISHKCACENSKEAICKHSAALGLTYIYTPWLFNGRRMKRSNISNIDELKYYISTTPLREMFIELRGKGINLSDMADLLKVSAVQLSSVIKEDQLGKTHQLTEPIKLACAYLLDKTFKM